MMSTFVTLLWRRDALRRTGDMLAAIGHEHARGRHDAIADRAGPSRDVAATLSSVRQRRQPQTP